MLIFHRKPRRFRHSECSSPQKSYPSLTSSTCESFLSLAIVRWTNVNFSTNKFAYGKRKIPEQNPGKFYVFFGGAYRDKLLQSR